MIASKDLENWALIQPGGDTLKLKIKVEMEEKLYLRQILANSTIVKPVNPTPKQLGNMKAIKLTFSDRYTTQVAFSLQNISPDYHNGSFFSSKYITKLSQLVRRCCSTSRKRHPRLLEASDS